MLTPTKIIESERVWVDCYYGDYTATAEYHVPLLLGVPSEIGPHVSQTPGPIYRM